MNTHLIFPDPARRRHPFWVERVRTLDCRTGPATSSLLASRSVLRARPPVLPGERIELVTVLRKNHSRIYQELPLQLYRDRLHVLRRVQLTRDYTYRELYQSPRYRQWLQTSRLQPYILREFAPVARRRSPVHWLREAC